MGVTTKKRTHILPARISSIEDQIIVVRGQRVMLDSDLARIYGVTTKRINEQVKRNRSRFPVGFMLHLTLDEAERILSSRSQIATLKRGSNVKHAPHAFTEHGAIMLASVLNSPIAVQASVFVVRAFVRMRSIIAEYSKLAERVDALELTCDAKFRKVFDAIRSLILQPEKDNRQIGFVRTKNRKAKLTLGSKDQ